ncbi:DUF305 domain-containing protein [Pseudonocardia sp. KRD-184]|uniref:DUF305 domain-containing protein n=1 Tax=Pseudonocardia oceani TaxID=2792013 RepID=A0ABS6U847_9PSEU|nr:DUF305 domain-containing protein [Pseudonocardia oceani]MBW0088672.1 DUF305 domain-containing protein [Pseudonocardia oceani]MBW0095549.1 DUF305 domain-containing protein [Pseudonocardia oceani]MBW0108213.1 DUF305 domain-containing protein [Pseudonocardia oceani]MBW0120650.1 DUF305 domain-containing protein [Pseudonocardia oceani]MBW0128416.1 DUF305 domain-containing protein [Pseudonocardia oceani]
MKITKLTSALTGAAVVGLALAGCAAGTDTTTPGAASSSSTGVEQTTAHNEADVSFAQGMTVHHQQAVEMAELAATRSRNPQVIDLAARIGAAQGPEIETLNSWLEEWGADVPSADTGGGMGGMDHGGTGAMGGMGGMGGMMTPEQMTRLEQASGPAFDRMFLEMMTEHHTGAVEMARTELAEGSDPRATGLAQTIIDTQQAEIDEMAQLLTQI